MKNKVLSFILFGVIALNLVLISGKMDSQSEFLGSLVRISSAVGEESTVTCDSGQEGICYADDPGDRYDCCPDDPIRTPCLDQDIMCQPTGDPEDCCDFHEACVNRW